VSETITKLKNKRQEQAAHMIADDRHSDMKISKILGMHFQTLAGWKKRPEFAARVAELVATYAEQATRAGLANRNNRIRLLQEQAEKIQTVIDERATDPAMAAIPGGKTGLIVRTPKVIGDEVLEVYRADVGLLKELRATNEQIAREKGEWQESVVVEDVSRGDLLERARQRALKATQTRAPESVVVEQEIAVPATDLPN
jgi:hypothetical protein